MTTQHVLLFERPASMSQSIMHSQHSCAETMRRCIEMLIVHNPKNPSLQWEQTNFLLMRIARDAYKFDRDLFASQHRIQNI